MRKKTNKNKKKRKSKTVKPKKTNQNLKIKQLKKEEDESVESYSIWKSKKESVYQKNKSQPLLNKNKDGK